MKGKRLLIIYEWKKELRKMMNFLCANKLKMFLKANSNKGKYRICQHMAFVDIGKEKTIDFKVISKFEERIGSFPFLVKMELDDEEKALRLFYDISYKSSCSGIVIPYGYVVTFYSVMRPDGSIITKSPVNFFIDKLTFKKGTGIIKLPNRDFANIFAVLGGLKGYTPKEFVYCLAALLTSYMHENADINGKVENFKWYKLQKRPENFISKVIKEKMDSGRILMLAQDYLQNGNESFAYREVCEFITRYKNEECKEYVIKSELDTLLQFANQVSEMQRIPIKGEYEIFHR